MRGSSVSGVSAVDVIKSCHYTHYVITCKQGLCEDRKRKSLNYGLVDGEIMSEYADRIGHRKEAPDSR